MIKSYDFLYEDVRNFLEDEEYLLDKQSGKKVPIWWVDYGKIAVDSNTYTASELLEYFTLLDGSPCGMEREDFPEWEPDKYVKKSNNKIMDIFNIF